MLARKREREGERIAREREGEETRGRKRELRREGEKEGAANKS